MRQDENASVPSLNPNFTHRSRSAARRSSGVAQEAIHPAKTTTAAIRTVDILAIMVFLPAFESAT
jgi:hypothetical protein